jgi:hypothetical protein
MLVGCPAAFSLSNFPYISSSSYSGNKTKEIRALDTMRETSRLCAGSAPTGTQKTPTKNSALR